MQKTGFAVNLHVPDIALIFNYFYHIVAAIIVLGVIATRLQLLRVSLNQFSYFSFT